MSNMTTDKSHPDTWYVTFGLGTPNGSTYSEILVDRETSSFCAPEEIERRVRDAVLTRYGTEWAFIYWPHEAHRAKLRATLRERIDLHGRPVESAPSIRAYEEKLQYDRDSGELQTLIDGQVRSIIEIRKTLQENVLRQAVIVELEKLGYTVLSPEAKVPH
jgi:hypothetical protein